MEALAPQDPLVANVSHDTIEPNVDIGQPNGIHPLSVDEEPFVDVDALDLLEIELPVVHDGQVPLGEVITRTVQAVYAELSELAETMPNMSDSARKRTLADWVVKVKRQIVKLYAAARWARDADSVQKCMNITAFLLNHNQQFTDTIAALDVSKQNLDSARLRNHDLLTSLDVLTYGTYLRLPSGIKRYIIPEPPLEDKDVVSVLETMESTIRYRLSMSEVVPQEMSRYRIANGRVYFTSPKLFEASMCLRGGDPADGWFFVHAEFLFKIGGDPTSIQDFPRKPTGLVLRHIIDEADARLAFYIPPPTFEGVPGMENVPILAAPQLPPDTVDAPLIRVFNFLQIMSLSYQLEILWYQAEQLKTLGWADHLDVEMSNNRKTLTISYWVLPAQLKQQAQAAKEKLPPHGGTLTISIVETPLRQGRRVKDPKSNILFGLQQKAKIGNKAPSDTIENLSFQVKWEIQKGVLAVPVPEDTVRFSEGSLFVDTDDLDLESLLKKAIERHTAAILNSILLRLVHPSNQTMFASLRNAFIASRDSQTELHVHLYANTLAVVTIDARTGHLALRDTGELAALGRGSRFMALSERLNFAPSRLFLTLAQLRVGTIVESVQQKANSLGLTWSPQKNFPPDEQRKLGPDMRATVFIQLDNFKNHFLVIVVTDNDFRYGLVTVSTTTGSMFGHSVMSDMAWLDSRRIQMPGSPPSGGTDLLDFTGALEADSSRFNLTTQALRELYAYCCARVAYINVERQLKLRGIPFSYVDAWEGTQLTPEISNIQSSLARSVPALCVQSEHILSGAPAAEAAMPNIRVIPLNWWCGKKQQVVTCVKLKYVQRPVGRKAASGSVIIRPSESIIYDTVEAVVCFLSDNVATCVNEFLEEWARVSKIVVIAREVSQMAEQAEWSDVKLLSFDLQTVQFAYACDYVVSITCTDQLSITGGSFAFRFSKQNVTPDGDSYNPHEEAEPFLRNVLRPGHGRLSLSLHRLVSLLRDTLPIVIELDSIRMNPVEGISVDTVVKAAGWYRIVYGNYKHAVDFRLIKDHRVVIVDGSRSFFRLQSDSAAPQTKADGGSAEDDETKALTPLALRPIPNFYNLVCDGLMGLMATNGGPELFKSVTFIDIGIICDAEQVTMLAPAIHQQLSSTLRTPSAPSIKTESPAPV